MSFDRPEHPTLSLMSFAGPRGAISVVRDVVARLPTCPRFWGIVGKDWPFAGNPECPPLPRVDMYSYEYTLNNVPFQVKGLSG